MLTSFGDYTLLVLFQCVKKNERSAREERKIEEISVGKFEVCRGAELEI